MLLLTPGRLSGSNQSICHDDRSRFPVLRDLGEGQHEGPSEKTDADTRPLLWVLEAVRRQGAQHEGFSTFAKQWAPLAPNGGFQHYREFATR